MPEKRLKDCYITSNNGYITIENSLIERGYTLDKGKLNSIKLIDKQTGFIWESVQLAEDMHDDNESVINISIENNNGLSEDFLMLSITDACKDFQSVKTLAIYPDSPFITTGFRYKGRRNIIKNSNEDEENCTGVENNYSALNNYSDSFGGEAIDALNLVDRHFKVKSVKLFDKTDINDTLIVESEQALYKRGTYKEKGNIFIIDDTLSGSSLMLLKESPTHLSSLSSDFSDIEIKGNKCATIIGTGFDRECEYSDFVHSYGATIGIGNRETILSTYKKHYKKEYKGDLSKHNYIMSNTWGDRNQDAAVCHDFIMREIDIAHEIGVDIVQIDDGWEKGITANSKLAKGGVWEGYYAFNNEFWEINEEKFPHGFKVIVDYAKQLGIKIALWFSPDSSNDFANWEKDVKTLLSLHNSYSVDYFKFDGVKIRNKQSEANFIKLMEQVSLQSNNEISFNLDITAEERFGYLYYKQYGNLFVENRYTDWGNYFPHNTIKNLWTVSQYFPANKFQFEVLNNERNTQIYGDDILAPSNYDIDYEFASVMVANPLIWMELTGLSEKSKSKLKTIITVYKKYRDNFFNAEILPIGDQPSGASFTGFQIICDDKSGYLILLRETTEKSKYVYNLKLASKMPIKTKVLLSNLSDISNVICGDTQINENIIVTFDKPRSYIFAEYSLK